MPVLKSLQFAALQKDRGNPVLGRRAKLIEKLAEQRMLAQNPTHIRTRQRWVKNGAGGKDLTAVQQRVRPWWRTDITGQTVIALYHGSKPMEIEKGKPAVVVPSPDKLVAVIDTLIEAVRQGELDELLNQQTKARGVPKAKRAA